MADQIIVVKSGPPGPTGATGATGATGPDSSDLQDPVGSKLFLYVDADNGDDSNTGLSYAQRVATWEKVISLMCENKTNEIYVHADMDIDYRTTLYNPPKGLIIQGRNAANTSDESRDLAAITATNSASRSGGLVIYGFMGLTINDCNVILNTAQGYAVFEIRRGAIHGEISDMTLTRTGAGTCRLFYADTGGAITMKFSSCTLTAAGYVFSSVSAAADPNDEYYYNTNITSA